MPRDIIDSLIGQAFRTHSDMLLHVTLIDRANKQRYHFQYPMCGLRPEVAIEMARAELTSMWRKQ